MFCTGLPGLFDEIEPNSALKRAKFQKCAPGAENECKNGELN